METKVPFIGDKAIWSYEVDSVYWNPQNKGGPNLPNSIYKSELANLH